MTAKTLTLLFVLVIVTLQYPLWLGDGGWFRVWEVEQQDDVQKQKNEQLELRNRILDADVQDLKQGIESVEERARSLLGMIKNNEIFIQFPDAPKNKLPSAPRGSSANTMDAAVEATKKNQVTPSQPLSRLATQPKPNDSKMPPSSSPSSSTSSSPPTSPPHDSPAH